MALLFIDGFDHYPTSDIPKKYQLQSSAVILPTSGRMGGGCLLYDSFSDYVQRTIITSTNVIVGAAMYLTGGDTGSGSGIFTMMSGTTQISKLTYNNSGKFVITNSSNITLGTSENITTFTNATWNYIEWKMQIADSIPADTCIVRVNGVEVLNLPVGTDTRAGTDPTTIQSVRIGAGGTSPFSCLMRVDDFYICNTTGSSPTDFLGDVRVDTLLPTADGTYNDGVPSTGTNSWSILDNVPPVYTEYVSLTNTAEKETLQFSNLSSITSQTIYGIQVDLDSAKSDAGAKTIAPLALSSSTLSEAANSALTTSYVFSTGIFTTDPNTSTAWDESGVNSAEFGIVIK